MSRSTPFCHRGESIPGTIYLLCFDRPLAHARHYLGWVHPGNLEQRLEEHRNGTSGAKLMAGLHRAGIGFTLIRTWQDVDRHEERRLKNYNGLGKRLCPRCMAAIREARQQQQQQQQTQAAGATA